MTMTSLHLMYILWLTMQTIHMYMRSTNRVVFVLVTEYLLGFDQRLHHALVQRQLMLVRHSLHKLCRVALYVDQQDSDLLVLHRNAESAPSNF